MLEETSTLPFDETGNSSEENILLFFAAKHSNASPGYIQKVLAQATKKPPSSKTFMTNNEISVNAEYIEKPSYVL